MPNNPRRNAFFVVTVAGLFANASTMQQLCTADPQSMNCDYPLEVFHEISPEIPMGGAPISPYTFVTAAASTSSTSALLVSSAEQWFKR